MYKIFKILILITLHHTRSCSFFFHCWSWNYNKRTAGFRTIKTISTSCVLFYSDGSGHKM